MNLFQKSEKLIIYKKIEIAIANENNNLINDIIYFHRVPTIDNFMLRRRVMELLIY